MIYYNAINSIEKQRDPLTKYLPWRIQNHMRLWQAAREKKRMQKYMRMIPIDKLLMGGDGGVSAYKFARLTGNLLRPSTLMLNSPHVQLLLEWERVGSSVFKKEHFEQTAYYQNAIDNIDLFGHYFDAKRDNEIVHSAERFLKCYQGIQNTDCARQHGQSGLDDPICLYPIQYSDCFGVMDGHHRVAIACARGETEIRALPMGPEILTPMQELLLDVMWLNGRKELYQPVDLPELHQQWVLVRRCEDRLHKMLSFLAEHNLSGGSYLDVASSYGWFVAKLQAAGFEAKGIERDPIANSIGNLIYNLDGEALETSECSKFLQNNTSQYDIVSAFSVLHHFILRKNRVSAEEFARLLDKTTRQVLFFETGQDHEKWFRERLRGWTPSFIEQWLRENTTFTKIVSLGVDEDDKPPFEENYGRTLFACVRT